MKENVSHAGGLVVRKNTAGSYELLLIRRASNPVAGKYLLPNGHVAENEESLTAAKREVKEETGTTDLRILADLGLVERRGVNDQGQRYLKSIHYYLFLTENDGRQDYQFTDKDKKEFTCHWCFLESYPSLIQFGEELSLLPLAKEFLGLPKEG